MEALVDDLEHATIYRKGPDDSEESDGEGGLGNLNRLIVRPPGHSGKAKRGHLCFDAAFECGNLGRADHITELEYDLFIRPDTCRPRSRFWFNFTVENVKQDQRVIFNLVNLGQEFTLYNGDMTPLVRSTSRTKWQRIPRRLIFYHRSIVHRGRKILSLAFGFDREEDVYQFAASYPYSYSRLQKHLSIWEKKAEGFAKRESIAQTTQKRRIDLITIEDFNVKGKSVSKKRVVLILARTHGGDSPASYICQGFLDFLVSTSEKAQTLRNNIVIQIVPMVNPDGVFLGNHRSDLLGSDLNRCWNRATSFAHPALIAVNELVKKISAEKTLQLDFIIDLHSDIIHEGVFVRGNSYDDVYRFERHAVLPKFLAVRVEAWQTGSCIYNADALLAGSARRALPAGAVDAYSLLASLGGRRLNSRGPYMHYTEDACILSTELEKRFQFDSIFCLFFPEFWSLRSPSSSPERRVLAARVLSPPLPAASPPVLRALPPRTARYATLRTRPKTVPVENDALPIIKGTAVRTPRLAVVDFSAYIRTPTLQGPYKNRPKLARIPRPTHARFTSDEYDTHESDS
ncbi:cytosolic carboxypeptidase 6-like [Zerene cesonia]|uniref:cytosolic carboxypeptidase 6-like n=1 Tax=Zerene cesonia TaxID=33412 RepID=UPI0018E520F8|nr:cytosolic carboxypeptidase 6-like [Zerene cesonia]